MTPVTACAFCDLDVALRIAFPMHTRPVLVELIHRQGRVVGADVRSIVVTLRAGCYEIQRMDGRSRVALRHNTMGIVAGCALRNAPDTRQPRLPVGAVAEVVQLVCRKLGAIRGHHSGMRMARGTDSRDIITPGNADEARCLAHGALHILCRVISPVASCTGDLVCMVDIVLEQRGRLSTECFVAYETLIRCAGGNAAHHCAHKCTQASNQEPGAFHNIHPSIVNTII